MLQKKSWEENKIFGNGVRSFRIECNKYRDIKKNACSSHPHNIYLELLSEVGLIGFFFFHYINN
jgi:O-antigen ligase